MEEDFPDTLPSDEVNGSATQEEFPDTLDPRAFSAAGEQDDFPDSIPAEEFARSPSTSTRTGAVARGVAEGAVPSAGGVAAGLYTAGALAPLGPWVSIPGGLLAGMGAGNLLAYGQDKVLEMMGLRDAGVLSREQQATDEAQHPYFKAAGEMAPAAATLSPMGSLAQRGVGAAIGGIATAGTEYLQEGHVDPGKVAMGAGMGAAFPTANRAGRAIENWAGRTPPAPQPTNGPVNGPWPNGPQQGPYRPGPPLEGDIIPPQKRPMTGDPEIDHNLKFAYESRDTFDVNDPMYHFWNEHISDLMSRGNDKASATMDADASLGPHGDRNNFTYHESNQANDITTTALGVAAENPPAPQIKGAGNPTGAPMQARVAARPNEPTRNYGKDRLQLAAPEQTQESTALSTAPMHEDISAALAAEAPPKPPVETGIPQGPAAIQRQTGQPYEASARQAETAGWKAPSATQDTGLTVAVTPQEMKILANARRDLAKAGMNEVLQRLDKLPPRAQVEAAAKIGYNLASKTGEAVGHGEIRTPEKRPTLESGVMARSKADLERKEGAIKAARSAFDKYAPQFEGEVPMDISGRLQAVDLAKEAFNFAKNAYGGESPLSYKPRVKPAEYQFLQAALKLAKKGSTPKNIADFYSTVRTLRAGGAKETQETARIEGDIAKKPQIEEHAGEAMTSQAVAERPSGRVEHEAFVNSGQQESATYTTEQNRLRNWLNSLSDETHARLAKEHPDMDLDVRTTQDPGALMQQYLNDLTKTPKGRVLEDLSSREIVAAGEKVPAPARSREVSRFAPTKEGGKASEGRVIDPNSPEGKAIAEAALQSKQRERTPAEKKVVAEAEPEAIDGTPESAADHFLRMMGDESGSAKTDQLLDWMKTKYDDYFGPTPSQPIKEYGDQLGDRFSKLANRLTQFKGFLLSNARTSPLLQNAEKSQLYRAMEYGQVHNLPTKLKKYYDDHVKPLADKYGTMYDEFRDNARSYGLQEAKDLPERKNNGAEYLDWVPRIQKGKHKWDAADENNVDPVAGQSGQTLNRSAETLNPRDFFALQNANGDRVVFIPGDGQITLMRNGAPSKMKMTNPKLDPSEIGTVIRAKINNRSNEWTVDHASVDEIQAAAGKNADGTPKIQFHDDPVVVYSNALYGLNNALERQKMYLDILNNKVFQDNHTRDAAKGKELGWIKSNLPQFEDVWMPKQIAWAMNDFVKRGITFTDMSAQAAKSAIDRWSQNFAKLFYFFGPAVHAMNEADKWAIGRGFRWVTPSGWKSLVENGMKAVKSVHTQDAIQREMIEAGANPMRAHTTTRDLMQKVAKATGLDVAKNPSKWDPIARAFGVSTKELARRAYDLSSEGMWYASDVLLTQRYLEEKQLRGLSPEKAVQSAHDFIDSYRMPTTLGKRDSNAGRFIQQALSDPSVSLFGPYHYGVFHTASNMLKGLISPKSTMADRGRAAGQLAVLMGLMYGAYPLLSAGYQKLTGDKHAEVEARGVSRLVKTGVDIARKEKGIADIERNIWTPSVTANTLVQGIANRDWRGKPIVEQGASAPRQIGQGVEYLAGQTISPYKTISGAAMKPDATAGSVARKFGESMVGIKTPSEAETKFKEALERHQNTANKAREKKPVGVIENTTNKLFR